MKPEENELNPYQKTLLPFDPIVLAREAAGKWILVLVIAVIVGMFAYIYTDSMYVPFYRTSATLVLTTRDSASTFYDSLDATSSLATVFTEVLNSSVMYNNIVRELGMDSFRGAIHAAAIESTNLMTVQVTAADPRTAFQVIRILLEQHDTVTYEIMGDIVLEVLEPPVVPTAPANQTDSARSFVLAFAAAAVAAFAVLAVMAYFRDVVRSKEEAEAKLDCWCLAEIQHETKRLSLPERILRRKRSILITDPQTNFRYVTTMSKLSRRVEQNMHGGKVLMVTSVMENEGKTTVAANLALALSKKYPKVLLMDCDLHKPAIRKVMEQGLPELCTQDVIQGKAWLADAVKTDKRSRLQMLFAKRSNPQEAGDMIGSAGMAAMIAQARAQFDYVVIDLPPMSAAPDSEAVTELADAALLVVRQNGVLAGDLNRAIEDLQRGKAKLLGCVLNNVYATRFFSGEGYGSGHGRYGGYGSYGHYGRYGRYAAYTQKQDEA
ncbi:MAG: P-loop NTPase [Oscillospiraceae bacterium]|nr:P-loop NTPase [Oscillospiraceae bacterium]